MDQRLSSPELEPVPEPVPERVHVQVQGEEFPFDRTDVRATFIVLYTVVFVFCFFGNLLVIVVVTLSRRMRSLTNFFLANLAVADLCVGVFCVYQNLSIYLAQSWVLGEAVCKLYHFVHNLSYTASIFILVVVGVERYLAVLYPITCRATLTPRRLKLVVAAVWLLSGALCGSRLYWAQTVTVHLPGDQEIICISNRHKYDQRLWDVLIFVLLYLLPLLVMAFLYARIASALWTSGRNLGRRQPQQRARRNVVKLVVAVVGAFAVCHLPLHARRLWQHWSPWYRGPSSFSALFTPTTFLIAYANSAANPLLYALLSNKFRGVLRDVLALISARRRSAGAGSLSSRGSRATAVTELRDLRELRKDGDPDSSAQGALVAQSNAAMEEEEEEEEDV